MTSAASFYHQTTTFTGLLSHGWARPVFVRDGDDEQQRFKQEIDVQVRSGDYFVTLATALDSVGRNATGYHVRAHIEDIVSDLIYLQDNYKIVKNEDTNN